MSCLRVHSWNYILEDEGSFRTLGIPIVPQPVEFPLSPAAVEVPPMLGHTEVTKTWILGIRGTMYRSFGNHFSSARLIGITLRVSNHYEPRYSNPLSTKSLWMFLKKGVPQNGWFYNGNTLLKWVILGCPYFWKHPYYEDIYTRILFETSQGAILGLKENRWLLCPTSQH